jgi:hypothetical protein
MMVNFNLAALYESNENIRRLLETEWVNRFTSLQLAEIRRGLEQDVDVSVYAIASFDDTQMRWIRKHMQRKLDFRKYAIPSISGDYICDEFHKTIRHY